VHAIPFSIHGAAVTAQVDPALLGDPTGFGWNAATRPGTTVPYVDFAPDAPGVLPEEPAPVSRRKPASRPSP